MSTEAGDELKALMSARGLSQRKAASAVNLSQPYISQMASGSRLVSAGWLDAVAEGLQLNDEERARLNILAARDHGFKIKL